MEPIQTTGIHQHLNWRIQWRRLTSLRWKDVRTLFLEMAGKWSEHRVPRLGASVAFYTLLSMAPLLIIVVAIAGAVFGREAAEGQLVWQIQDLVGRAGAETVQTLLRSTQKPGAGIIATTIGAIALVLGATTAVAELRDALNTIWCVPKRETSGLRSVLSMIVERFVAFATVVAIGFFLLVSVATNTAISAFTERFQNGFPAIAGVALQWADFLLAFAVIAILFGLIYKLLPDVRLEWRDVIPGAIFTAFLFSVGRVLLGYYLGRASYVSVYGAAGSLVAVLVWIYYSAQIFFLGAEFTRAYAQNFGSKPCDRMNMPRIEMAAGLKAIDDNTTARRETVPPAERLVRLSGEN